MHRLPPNGDKREKWINEIKKHQQLDSDYPELLICDLHFQPSFINRRGLRTLLNFGAVPTIFQFDQQLSSNICYDKDTSIEIQTTR